MPQRCRLLKRKSTSLPWRPRQPGENDFLGKIVRIPYFFGESLISDIEDTWFLWFLQPRLEYYPGVCCCLSELWTREQLYSAFCTGGLRTSWRQRGGCMDAQCDQWDQLINSNIKQKHCTTHQGIESKRLIKRHIKQLFNNFFQSLFGDWQFSTFQEMIVFAILRYIFLCNKKTKNQNLKVTLCTGTTLF